MEDLTPSERQRAIDASAGRTTSNGQMAYTAEQERALSSLPSITTHRQALQGANGRFLFKVNDDGTRTAGSFWIDSLGRFQSY